MCSAVSTIRCFHVLTCRRFDVFPATSFPSGNYRAAQRRSVVSFLESPKAARACAISNPAIRRHSAVSALRDSRLISGSGGRDSGQQKLLPLRLNGAWVALLVTGRY